MQRDETGLDHRGCVEVLQSPDVGRHQLRCLGGKYVHDRSDQVGGRFLAAQQQIGHSERTNARVARSLRSALVARRTGSRPAGSSVPPVRRCRASAEAVVAASSAIAGVGTPPDHTSASSCRRPARPDRRSGGTSARPSRRWRPAASNSTSLVIAPPDPGGPMETRSPSRSASRCTGSGVAHDHLQVVLVHPGHRLRCGLRGAGGSIPLGDVGQRQAQIDLRRPQAGQVLDGALGGEHLDCDVRVADLEPFRQNLRERQIQPARIPCGQAHASPGFGPDAAAADNAAVARMNVRRLIWADRVLITAIHLPPAGGSGSAGRLRGRAPPRSSRHDPR